jgi:hypothetical protein
MEDWMHKILVALFSTAAIGLVLAPALAEDAAKPLNLSKECSEFTAHSGDHCTITASNLDAIPVGSTVYYYGPVIGPTILSTAIVLVAGEGTTAIGYCNVELAKSEGACTFWAGSGKLAGFQALVNLTIDGTGLFHWDGSYTIASPM